ncbi:MAG: leucyl aminopeptidase [Rubripirellula sp.]|nr:leucyl aminopeptidase [Rubripirellula sp.]
MLESTPFETPVFRTVTAPAAEKADVVVVGLSESGELTPTLSAIDGLTDNWISRLIELGQLRGKQGELSLFASPLPEGPVMILVVGLGNKPATSLDAFESSASAIRKLVDRKRDRVIVTLAESFPAEYQEQIVAGAASACEGQALYQSDPPIEVPSSIDFSGIDQAVIDRGTVIGHSINHTRRLVNEPPAMVYPASFAERVEQLAEGTEIQVEIWDENKLEAEGCRAILAVGAGSSKPPRLVIMRYQGGGTEAPLALVGKGVTFDSGGLSLKPSDAMADMKCDMAGAATVVGVMLAAAKLGLRKNLIGLCGLAENMVSGDSYKLGDVIETRSGKTIEILNTDAEGRVVLADTLDVAVQCEPQAIVDLATLTGACMVALGTEVVGMMTNDQALCDAVRQAAEGQGEPVWQLPMFELYDEKVKSKVADIKNIGEGRWGGAITAAKFLENFVGDVPWLHLDIAGPAFAESPKSHRDAGATGVMVRTLVHWLESKD